MKYFFCFLYVVLALASLGMPSLTLASGLVLAVWQVFAYNDAAQLLLSRNVLVVTLIAGLSCNRADYYLVNGAGLIYVLWRIHKVETYKSPDDSPEQPGVSPDPANPSQDLPKE